MSLVKKLFVFALMVSTVTTMSLGSAYQVKAEGSYGAGSLLALEGATDAAVYYIGSDGLKYVYPDSKTYFTWYENFDNVVRVDVSELDMYADGGTVTYRPGTKLVTHMNTTKVYAIEPGGVLRWVADEATALALYGEGWAGMIQDVIPGYFSSSYTAGSDMGTTLPDGTLAIEDGGDTYYYIDDGTKRPFSSMDAFEANNFNLDNVLTVDLTSYGDGESITGEETALSGYMPAEDGGETTGGDVTVSLASDTPAAGIVVGNAARVPFTKIKLVTGNEGVTIDTIVVERGGIGQDGAFSSLDILDADDMLPIDPNSKTLNSNHRATFTKDIEIAANTTKYLYLAGNMAALTNYAGEQPALSVYSISLEGDGSVNGSLPISGNTQTLNGTITIGTATVQRGSYTNATSSTIEVGKQDYTFFSFQVNAGSAEDVTFGQVSVYQIGSADLEDDLSGIELLKDGTKVADGVVDGKYVNFTLDEAIEIPKGETKQFQVRADVEGGSARIVELGIYRNTDLLVTGQTYGYNITPTYSSTGSSTVNPRLQDNEFTISNGTLTVERSNTVGSESISIGNDQTLGAFKFTVKGEPIDITALTLTIVSSTGNDQDVADSLTNVRLVDSATGTSKAGPTDTTSPGTSVAFTDTFTLPVGETVLEVVGNLATAGGWATEDTIYARLNTPASAITATGEITGNSITASPASAINTNTQTIKGPYLSVTRNTLPASGTVIAGQQDVKLGSWSFDATNSGEDIRITSVLFAASSSNATNLTVYDGVFNSANPSENKKTPVNDAPSSDDDGATSTFAFEDPIIITKGTSQTIELVGDINSGAGANDSTQFGLTDATAADNPSVVAYGYGDAGDGASGLRATLSLTADNGATMTYAAKGAVTATAYNNPVDGIVRAGATGVTFGHVKFDALYENLDLDQLIINVDDGGLTGTNAGTYQDVVTVYLYDGATPLASNSIPSTEIYTFNFVNGTLTVPKDGSKTLTIKADLGTIHSTVDNNPATASADLKFGFGGTDGFQFTGDASNLTATETYNSSTSSSQILHKSIPTVTYSTSDAPLGAATVLTAGALDLFNFDLSADSAAEVLLYRASFEITTGGGATDIITVTSCILKDDQGNTIGASATPTEQDASATALLTWANGFNNPAVSAGDLKEAISIPAGTTERFTLNCTLGGANLGSSDYISVALVGDAASSTAAGEHGDSDSTGDTDTDYWASAWDRGSFVWSDNYKNRALDADGANATAWGQWYNGYLVSGFGGLTTGTAYTITWSS